MTQRAESADAIRAFLAATDHVPGELGEQYAGTLDPRLRPRPDKRYPTLAPLPLPPPDQLAPSAVPALAAIADPGASRATAATALDRAALARLCFFTHGITRRLRVGERTVPFRAAPCTGALYHQELHLVTGGLPDLPAGVYHYGAHDHALRRLRDGDFRPVVVEATGGEEATAAAQAIMVVTSVFWRNAWKYAARAYRHAYWDVGTMLPNTFAVAAAAGIPAQVVLGFADQPVADLLGIDLDREGVIALVALGRARSSLPPAPPVPPLDLPIEPYSAREIDFPLIRQTHRATLLASGAEAATWRQRPSPLWDEPPRDSLLALPVVGPAGLPREPIETVIRRRGSTRRFTREPIALEQLATLLHVATRGIPSDVLGSAGIPLNTLSLFVNAVDGLPSGTYVYHPGAHALEPLRRMPEDEARAETHFLALDQDLGGDAAVDVYFLADLESVLETYGPRGYRLAELGAALVAGKLYLAAYALRLGATGLTFYDPAVTAAFSPHAAGKHPTFLIAIGHPA